MQTTSTISISEKLRERVSLSDLEKLVNSSEFEDLLLMYHMNN